MNVAHRAACGGEGPGLAGDGVELIGVLGGERQGKKRIVSRLRKAAHTTWLAISTT